MPRCEECSRDFADEMAYSQHMSDKHGIRQQKKEMEKAEYRNEGDNKWKRYRKKRGRKKYGIIAVIVMIIAAGFLLSPKSATTDYTPILGIDNIVTFKGDEDAPVVIEEFSDYQCPFCSRFVRETLPQLQSQYIDTGKVRLVFKDFPLPIHAQAQKAAEAALCAGDQGKYWEMHDIIFANQDRLFVSDLKKYAGELGLNKEAFDACLDSGIMSVKVRENIEEGRSRGVSATPYFFVNGKAIRGAQPFSQFRFAIEAALAEAGLGGGKESREDNITAETTEPSDNSTVGINGTASGTDNESINTGAGNESS